MEEKEMDSPVSLQLVLKDLEVVSHFETRPGFEIELAAGQVVLRKISNSFVDGAMDVVLSGREVFQTLGIILLTELEDRAAGQLEVMTYFY